MEKKIPTYLLIIDEELSSELQVDAVAMVDAPAIERNFLQFKNETVSDCNGKKLSFAVNEDKQEIFGPAMLADVPIYRNDGQLGEYNVVFDKATIYKIAQKFFEKDFNKNFNLMHDPNQKCTGVYAFQSYIVDSTEGRPAPKGYEDAKDGSWFLGVKVNNAEVWSKIKSGEIKGFSVEGVFEYKKQELTANENVTCSNCNHSWNTSDSKEADKYVCHNCGFDNSAEQLYNQIKKLLQEVDS